MTLDPLHGHSALRRGRFSQTGAGYFLTICTAEKRIGLADSVIAGAILSEAKAMSADGTWLLRCAVVMPDHLHLLIELGARLPLAKTVQRLKAKTSASLRTAELQWARGFFDRKLRPADELLPLFLYIYLNPYRAGLLTSAQSWSPYYCCEADWSWVSEQLDQERPIPAWLEM
jgi:REP element-mobilizing transposase RayT